jgi:hypothetical protein
MAKRKIQTNIGIPPPYWGWKDEGHEGGLDADTVDGLHATELMATLKEFIIPTNGGWTLTLVNSGAVIQDVMGIIPHTGATANSKGLACTITLWLNSGDRNVEACDYSKSLEWTFLIHRINSDAQVKGRIQLKQTASEGVLADTGIGIEITNYTLTGEAYGSARGTVALGTLTDGRLKRVKIVLVPGVRVDFYIDDVLTGSLTGTAVPSGVNASTRIVVSMINGASGGTDCYLDVGKMKIKQEW